MPHETARQRPTAVTGEQRDYLGPMGPHRLLAALYDPFTHLAGVRGLHRRLLDAAAIGPEDRVLEIGCGTGNLILMAKAAQPGAAVVGLDPDLPALARAHRKAQRKGLALQLDRGYADELPYGDDSLDVVLSAFMLHHLEPADRDRAAREVHRVLRPGGRLHLVDIGGHAAPSGGRAARRAMHDPPMHGNLGEGIPELLRGAGFTEVAETGHARLRSHRLTYYRATVSSAAPRR